MNLLAAQNTASLHGSTQSDSGSIGISFGTSGFGVTASASSARGKEAGDDLIHSNTHITAGKQVTIKSGNDTTLQGALVKADTIQADIGGDLRIESLQDTSTYDSKQSSMSASVTVGAGASGSFSASKSKVNSDFASVAEQSGFKAGDGGFQVNVGGDTTLIGGAIASNQSAVAQGLNEFTTDGTLTITDIQNKADYNASSTSVGVGGGTDGKNKGMSGVGVGVGSDSGHASSVTTAGISGIAGDTAIRSTDAEAGIARIFEKERVQKEIEAQTKITEAFSREAPKAVASYAAAQELALKQQLRDETDPAKQEALKAEIDKWGEGGQYRVTLHTLAGALGGGLSGAAGAAVSGASADLMQALQDNLQQGLESAGLTDGVAKGIAQGIATLTAAGVGAAVGGSYGAASAAAVDANNRQLHPSERSLAQDLAKKSGGKYTAEQIENAMRSSGNRELTENITAGMVLEPRCSTPIWSCDLLDGTGNESHSRRRYRCSSCRRLVRARYSCRCSRPCCNRISYTTCARSNVRNIVAYLFLAPYRLTRRR